MNVLDVCEVYVKNPKWKNDFINGCSSLGNTFTTLEFLFREVAFSCALDFIGTTFLRYNTSSNKPMFSEDVAKKSDTYY